MAGYAKLFGSILFSTIWGESKDVKILWITMMAMADPDGVVEAAVPGLAAASRLTVDECRVAIAVLEAPDPDSKNPDHEGRRIEKCEGGWRLLNYLNYRDKLTVAHRREKTAERVRKFRERKASPPAASDPPTDHDGSPDETVCPLDLTTRAEKIFPDMLEHMPGVAVEQLRDKTREFLSYWTIGGGKFKKRRFWMRKLREDLRLAFEKKRLKAPGEIEHEERKPKPIPLTDGAAKLIAMAKEEDAKRAKRRRVAAE